MALYDSENNKLLDTNDNVLEARVAGLLGDKTIQKQYIGSQEVKAIYIGSNLVYEKEEALPQLDAPTISLSDDTLSIEEVENAEYYDIYVDGVLKESISARTIYQHNIVYNDTTFGDNQNKTMTILSYDSRNLAQGGSTQEERIEMATAIISASTTEKTYNEGFREPPTTITFDDYPTLTQDREIAENWGAIQFTLTGYVSGVYTEKSLQNMHITSDTVSEYQGE